MKLRIDEVMTKDVAKVAAGTPIEEVVAIMLDRRISCVLVCEDDVPIGVISERDLVQTLAERIHGGARTGTACDVMSGPPVTVGHHWSVERAMEVVQQHRIRRLPVVDGNEGLLGLVTQTDLLAAQREVLTRAVQERTRDLQRANERLRELSMKDGLLGIGNRRAMNEALDRLHRIAERYRRTYSVVLVDVDHFKGFNDYYGHPEADEVLKRLAGALCEAARNADMVFRYGGEEILIILPETPIEGALVAAERARAAVFDLGIPSEPTPVGRVTVSCGLACSHLEQDEPPASWRDVLSRADASLYDAKRSGRNRVGSTIPGEDPKEAAPGDDAAGA
ncbi:MAG: diguanylate cyclase [Myxococcales bacterium]|nr:diguanylate cyclase [Myxococcales bacterium]